MTKKFHWDDPLDKDIFRIEKEYDPLPKKPLLKDDPLIVKEYDPLVKKPSLMDDLLMDKKIHEDFVHRHRLEMERDQQMRDQFEFEQNQRLRDDFKMKQEADRYFNDHFDNIERIMGPMADPPGHKFKL